MTTKFHQLPQFTREFKKLAKKYRSLWEDLEEFKRVLEVQPLGTGKHFNVITRSDKITVVKARLFCRYLKGSSLRIIYAGLSDRSHVVFIDIYFKGDQENEDRARIEVFLKDKSKWLNCYIDKLLK